MAGSSAAAVTPVQPSEAVGRETFIALSAVQAPLITSRPALAREVSGLVSVSGLVVGPAVTGWTTAI